MGGLVRVAGLTRIFEDAGATVHEVPLRIDHRAGARDIHASRLARVARSEVVPEALSWSATSALRALEQLEPTIVVCETSRAFDPLLCQGPWNVVLDYVDRLSVSYHDRSRIAGPMPKRFLFGALSRPAARFERRPPPSGVATIAAGWADADALGAEWVPITYDPIDPVERHPVHDLVFFGNLSYPPNVEAVDRLVRLWPAIRERRPETTMLLAGAQPLPRLIGVADELGWTLAANFPDLGQLLGSARLGIVPLVHASGIQTKVLEAALHGLPQIVDPVAVAGMRPGFPVCVARDDAELVTETIRLLEDEEALVASGTAAAVHMREHYSTAALVPWARRVLGRAA